MPAYKFEALTAAGKSTTGLVEADNARAAAQLRAMAERAAQRGLRLGYEAVA